MNDNDKVRKNSIYSIIKSVCAIVFPLITFPYASRVLTVDYLGKVNYGNSIVSYFTLFASLGITTYAIRECSNVKESKEELSKRASEIYSINIISMILSYLSLALTLIFAHPLYDYRAVIVIESMAIVLSTIGTDWINTAMEDFKYITIRTVVFQALALLLMVAFVHKPNDYLKYAVINVISTSGANIVNLVYRRKFCKIRFTKKLNLKKHTKPILLLFSLSIAQTIYVNSDMTILGLIKGDKEVGLYSVSVKIYTIIQALINSIVYVVMPQLSYNFKNKNYSEVNKLLRYSMGFIITLGMPCVVGVNALSEEIVTIIAGQSYIGAIPSLHILSVALATSFIAGYISNMIMIPSGRDTLCLVSSIICAIFNLITNLIFIPKYGLNAAAATTAFSQILAIIIKLPFIQKEIQISKFKVMVIGPLTGCIGIIAVCKILQAIVYNLYIRAICSIVASIIVYSLALIISKNEIGLSYFQIIKSKIKK